MLQKRSSFSHQNPEIQEGKCHDDVTFAYKITRKVMDWRYRKLKIRDVRTVVMLHNNEAGRRVRHAYRKRRKKDRILETKRRKKSEFLGQKDRILETEAVFNKILETKRQKEIEFLRQNDRKRQNS